MKSGIWVEAEIAKLAAENMIHSIKVNAWREYRGYLYMLKHTKKAGFFSKAKNRKKPLTLKKTLREMEYSQNMFCGTRKEQLRFWRDTGRQRKTCHDVIRACKVPPADGRIFLTLDDVKSIGL